MTSVDLILDTDIGTDVDDAYALAFALRHPDISLVAVTTVSGDPVRRAHIARKLLVLGGHGEIEVAAGVSTPLETERSAWMGHEGEGLLDAAERWPFSSRHAVDVLISETASGSRSVATVGMQSNVAAALDRDPAFAGRVQRLAVMGGVFGARAGGEPVDPGRDHNLNVDRPAAVRALGAGMRVLYVPCNVTFDTAVTGRHVDRLRSGDDLCRALVALTEVWAPIVRRTGRGAAEDQVAALHDPLTVACLVDRRFVTTEQLPVTVALHGGNVRTFVDPVAGAPAEVVTAVDAEGFADYWLDVITAGG